MKTYLVRQARSLDRDEWAEHEGWDDALRPLSDAGRVQAERLARQLAGDPPTRILVAPGLRFQQTVQPLAARLGLEAEVDERLARGEAASRVLELLPTFDEGPLLLCATADVIASLLHALELVAPGRVECRKGSVWVLEGQGYTPTQATYVEPLPPRRRRSHDTEAEPQDAVRAAVLDLGSTSFNLLVADVSPQGAIAPVVREKVMLRLGAVIAEGGSIPPDVQQRACAVALELAEVARREKCEHLYAVATAALRSASNGADVARAIGVTLGHPVRLLTGREEARAIFRAFQQRLELDVRPVLGVDLGGGSLELAVGSRDEIRAEVTTDLGALRLQRALVRHDPLRPEEEAAVRARVERELALHRDTLREGAGHHAIATGGTVRALARLVVERTAQRQARSLQPELTLPELSELRRTLVTSTRGERLQLRGISRSRVDVLPVGALVLEAVARSLDLTGYRICDWGLREGVLIQELLPDH